MRKNVVSSQKVLLRVTGADILESVRMVNLCAIPIYQFVSEDPLTATIEIHRRNLEQCQKILEKKGDIVKIQRAPATPIMVYLLKRRLLLTIGISILGLLLAFLPTRILFVEVEGNHAIPDRVILEAADATGIRLFALRRAVRSEKMKNALLSRIPELQWAGVNTYGCRAVISVRERVAPESVESYDKRISSVVAARDGIIQSATALSGSLSCREGQAVKKGQILISGYTDCGLCIRATRASGEIYARTNQEVYSVSPKQITVRAVPTEKKTFYSLVIGKKRIKLWKDSGIWGSTCGRIYREYPLTLPGGYILPISFACDTIFSGVIYEEVTDAKTAKKMLGVDSRNYLKSQMIAGTIQQSVEIFSELPDLYLLEGKYDCIEMIGRERMEKIGDLYGKNS